MTDIYPDPIDPPQPVYVPTAAQIAQLRDMIAEPTQATFTDADLIARTQQYAIPDTHGRQPWQTLWWNPTWDLNSVAADVWDLKTNQLVGLYDFTADRATLSRSQMYNNYRRRARYYNSRRAVGSVDMTATHDARIHLRDLISVAEDELINADTPGGTLETLEEIVPGFLVPESEDFIGD